MAQRFVPVCDGMLDISSNPPSCSGIWLNVDATGIPGAFDLSTLDPASVAGYFAAGFSIVGASLVLGIAVGVVLRTIRGY